MILNELKQELDRYQEAYDLLEQVWLDIEFENNRISDRTRWLIQDFFNQNQDE